MSSRVKIYTKTGDSGQTSLYGGKRVSKADAQVDLYGSIDELNCWVGLVVSMLKNNERHQFLQKIQSDLFIIAGHLAGWESDLSSISSRVAEMEVEIDVMDEKLPQLQNFILPGGTTGAAYAHICRSMTRRVERQLVKFSTATTVDAALLKYFNRLSDLFFVLARFINQTEDVSEIIWKSL